MTGFLLYHPLILQQEICEEFKDHPTEKSRLMANIKVITFGKLKEISGSNFELEAETTDELLHKIYQEFPSIKELKLRVAVNQKIISEITILNNNDLVALMPPYSGG